MAAYPAVVAHQGTIDNSGDRPARSSLVLAIDDDEDNLLLLNYALELLDCEFIGETKGRAALEIARQRQPSLILLDVILLDINGVELLHHLKQDVRTQHIPVIAVTGLASSNDRAELLEKGFADYISKPYMVDELEALVQLYLTQIKPCQPASSSASE